MIILGGKYAHAKVFLPNSEYEGDEDYVHLDLATKNQIISFLDNPVFKGRKIRVMPDTHFGKGSCVGFTMDLGEYVIPNIVGVDIGCGIMATKLPIKYSPNADLDVLDEFIRKNIPSGFSIHSEYKDMDLVTRSFDYSLRTLPVPDYGYERALKSIGTLGGGNHFIELGKDEEDYLWLTIHSGSRNLGLRVANHFQEQAKQECAKYFVDYGDLNFLIEDTSADYINSMLTAQEYAHINRKTMTRTILDGFFGSGYLEQIDSVHNYIDFNDGVIRKGATAANEGQRLVIPFNMEEGLIIGTGKGNADWNYSAPHGAGRILSRNAAKKILSLEEARTGMQNAGVFTTSLSQETLDEAKGAYKSKDLIVEMISETVDINHWVKPIYNFKAKS